MNKLKTIIQYECTTAFKYIWIFYGIQFSVIALISAIIAVSTGSLENVGTNGLEMSSLIYVSILGVLGFKEDFKMLIQNGFTRKYIFLATMSLFLFISGIMSLFDTVVGNLLHYYTQQRYSSIFGSIYGYDNIFANWIWLFLVYVLVCTVMYLAILVINKLGKILSIYLGIVLVGSGLLVTALFRYVLSSEMVTDILKFAGKSMGFLENGTINIFLPILTFLLFTIILGGCSYAVLRRTELK